MNQKLQTILEGLNDEQKKAVEAMEGPVLIVAGAGSGKTRVLTSRVAYMMASGVDPARILALTFTKKAATEMKERIALMVGNVAAKRVTMGTFHAIFVRFLREYAEFLGYPKDFTIYDSSDSISAIKSCIKALGLDDKLYKPKDVLGRISSAKNNLITCESYATRTELLNADSQARKPRICDLYRLYQDKMRNSGVMDFDDILLNMNILLRDNREALLSLSDRFSYIMVDEYQDTNFSQYNIIRKLTLQHHNICVVGDDSQSIYAFRGARVQNILNFQKDYPECKVIRLERNYRSTQTIVNAANSVIEHNSSRIPKNCYSEADAGEKIRILECMNEIEEAARITSEVSIRKSVENGHYSDFAILYRTNSQSRAIEDALRRRNIPYMVYSGNSFYERAEIKDMMSYLKLVANVNDDESFKRVVNKPTRGIGDTSVEALTKAANAHKTSLFKAIWLDDLASFDLKSAAQARLKDFGEKISRLSAKVLTIDANVLARETADDMGYLDFLKKDTSQEGVNKLENVNELLDSIETYVQERTDEALENEQQPTEIALPDFLENVSLLSNADTSADGDENDKVALMTVHSSKGLEFPYVIIAGMETNLFPSLSMMGSSRDLEEERRLFYVALTRAKKSVVITHCDSRLRNGKTETNELSMFVKEIDPKYLANPPAPSRPSFGTSYGRSSAVRYESRTPRHDSASRPDFASRQKPQSPMPKVQSPRAAAVPPPVQLDFVPDKMEVFRAGQRVEHNRFGSGRIISLTGEIPELRAEVEFDAYGKKILLLKYAKMRVEKEH